MLSHLLTQNSQHIGGTHPNSIPSIALLLDPVDQSDPAFEAFIAGGVEDLLQDADHLPPKTRG